MARSRWRVGWWEFSARFLGTSTDGARLRTSDPGAVRRSCGVCRCLGVC
jgi:hypothetical protein